jgi:hypothetical protein
MSSHALRRWQTDQSAELDRVQAAHHMIGGVGPGRRWRIQHINDSYILLLAAHFQLFCRNLHTEAATFFVSQMPIPVPARTTVQVALMRDRQLDRANAQPGSLGSDFGRLGMDLWKELENHNPQNKARQQRLEQLNVWRNAIAHQSLPLGPQQLRLAGSSSRTLRHIRDWRTSCAALAKGMDRTVASHLQAMIGVAPW